MTCGLVRSDNNLEKLQHSINRELAKVIKWLTANKLSLIICKTNYPQIEILTQISLKMNVNGKSFTNINLGVIVDGKPTWK